MRAKYCTIKLSKRKNDNVKKLTFKEIDESLVRQRVEISFMV